MGLFHRVTKRVFFGRFMRPWRWPKDVSQEGWERVTLSGARNARLAAVLGTAHSLPAAGAIVLAHPMSVTAKGYWLKQGHAELLRKSGFHVLAFDFNGFGESESTTYDYPADVIGAGEYLRTRFGDIPLGVVGCSFGAGYALCAMARPEHRFRGAVLEAAFPSLPYFWRQYPLPHAMLKVWQVVYPPLERSLRPSLAATQLKNAPHVLLIHGDQDTVSPVQVGAELQQMMRGAASSELWTVPGADHALVFAHARDAYAERVPAFLKQALER